MLHEITYTPCLMHIHEIGRGVGIGTQSTRLVVWSGPFRPKPRFADCECLLHGTGLCHQPASQWVFLALLAFINNTNAKWL